MEKIKLPFGLRDGALMHISDVDSGLKCGCICPACGCQLMAKKGTEKTHHFAHHNAPECTHSLESALHLYAKQIIERRRVLVIPAYCKHIDGHGWSKLSDEKTIKIDKVYLEKKLGDFIPDVIVETKGHRLLIEIAVTHFIDETKFYSILSADISTIEIDLSPLRKNGFNKDAIKAAVVDGLMGKRWIYNAKDQLLSEAYIHRRAAEQKRREREKEDREKFYQQHKRPIRKRQAGSGLVWHIDGCPFKKRRFHTTDKSREFYANVECDCFGCESFRGFRDIQSHIICLGEYHKARMRGEGTDPEVS